MTDKSRIAETLERSENSVNQEAIEKFKELADHQRGEPERIMVRAQHMMGGGVMNVLVEHIGDLTHRMAEAVTFGPTEAKRNTYDKVNRCLNYCQKGPGVEVEFTDNMRTNAHVVGTDIKDWMKHVYRILDAYAASHKKLRVYNRLQFCARGAAYSLGYGQFGQCEAYLKRIKRMEREFDREIMAYYVNGDRIMRYEGPDVESIYQKKYIV